MTPSPAGPIWSKRRSGKIDEAAAARMLAWTAGRDVAPRPAADAELLSCDIWTNRAHCAMLAATGIISRKDERAIAKALDRLEADAAAGKFALDPALEDVHINVERYVAGVAGEAVAGVMHTARSRNDQSGTDTRLWLRDRLLERLDALTGLIDALAAFARREAKTLAPGWTHGQPAMPTSLGHWAAAHATAFARDAQALQALWPLINLCPLGTAASFGTSWPIDRAMTARLLGFDAPAPNSLDAISTRWEAEARVGGALAVMMTHLSSLAQDLVFFTTPPDPGLRLDDAHVTGSSIMPNKRNPDFAEVTRARAQGVHSHLQSLLGVGRGALSGYNRDMQWTKYWIMDLFWEAGDGPEVFADVIAGIRPDRAALAQAATAGFSLAADLADHLARTRKLPFRKAYHIVAAAVAEDEKYGWVRLETINGFLKQEKTGPAFTPAEIAATGDPLKALASRQSQGGPSPDDIKAQCAALKAQAQASRRWAASRRRALDLCRSAPR